MDINRLREVFDYDPETGEITWKNRKAGLVRKSLKAGHVSREGYVCIGLDYEVLKAHRIAWALHHGVVPNAAIDHVDGNRSNNKISNLRLASRSQNSQNIRKPYKNNLSSGVLGVYWHGQAKKWQAKIQKDGKPKSLGLFKTKEEASDAYLIAKRKIHEFCTI